MSDYLPRTVIILLLAFDHLSIKTVIGYGGSLSIHCLMTTPPSSSRKGEFNCEGEVQFSSKVEKCLLVCSI